MNKNNHQFRPCLIAGKIKGLFHILYKDPITNTIKAIVETESGVLRSVPSEDVIFLDSQDIIQNDLDVALYFKSYEQNKNAVYGSCSEYDNSIDDFRYFDPGLLKKSGYSMDDVCSCKEIKVGDRVKYISDVGIGYHTDINAHIGSIGTVRGILKPNPKKSNDKTVWYLVEFDDFIDGNNIRGLCKDGYGWFCKRIDIQLINEDTSDKKKKVNNETDKSCNSSEDLKVGDYVRTLVPIGYTNNNTIGYLGTIVRIVENNDYPEDDNKFWYLVDFIKDVGGHKGSEVSYDGQIGHCWWCTADELQKTYNDPSQVADDSKDVHVKTIRQMVNILTELADNLENNNTNDAMDLINMFYNVVKTL